MSTDDTSTEQPSLTEKARECRRSSQQNEVAKRVANDYEDDGDLAQSAPEGDRG